MTVREIKAKSGQFGGAIGVVSLSTSSKAKQYCLEKVVCHGDTYHGSLAPVLLIRRESGEGKTADTLVTLSPACALEVVKGILLNVRADYAATDEELLNVFRGILTTAEREAASVQECLNERRNQGSPVASDES